VKATYTARESQRAPRRTHARGPRRGSEGRQTASHQPHHSSDQEIAASATGAGEGTGQLSWLIRAADGWFPGPLERACGPARLCPGPGAALTPSPLRPLVRDGAVAVAGPCTRWHRYLRYSACGGCVTCAAGPRRWQRCCPRAAPPRIARPATESEPQRRRERELLRASRVHSAARRPHRRRCPRGGSRNPRVSGRNPGGGGRNPRVSGRSGGTGRGPVSRMTFGGDLTH
jgi:hypothetical protein